MTDMASVPRIRLDGMYTLLPVSVIFLLKEDDRSGLVAYHILQSGASCRLPKTPKSKSRAFVSHCGRSPASAAPRGIVHHYFDVSTSRSSFVR